MILHSDQRHSRSCDVASRDRVLTVTINRPGRRNALDRDASFELAAIFDAFERDRELRVAILTGAGDVAFCAGADLKQPAGTSVEDAVPSSGFGGLVARFGRTKPVVAAVNGVAVGGGFELALACDIVVAAENASFGLTEPRVGLAALSGGIQRLIREIGPKRAHAMLLTGRPVSAAEALRLGFVNDLVPEGELLDAARGYAEEILRCSPASIRATKQIADALDGQTVRESMESMWQLPAVKALFASPDSTEGPLAFAERRAPRWRDA